MTRARHMLAVAAALFVAAAAAGAPVVTTPPVATDVTDRSFAVAWQANQPVRGELRLFLDAGGTQPLTAGEGTVSDGAAYPGAELQGTVRVRAIGLDPLSEVFYQTETISVFDGSTTLWPTAPPFPSVVLPAFTGWSWFGTPRPPANDLVGIDVRAAGGALSAPGALVLVDVPGATYPVSAFVGEGEILDAAIVDLNNLYDELDPIGYQIQGGEVAQITVRGGQRGSASTTATLGPPSGGVRLVDLLAAPLVLPNAVPACSNGLDDDADLLRDLDDPGCSSYTDTSERVAGVVCDDGLDNDADGLIDYPSDPGCRDVAFGFELRQCDDNIDNDNDGKIDWDGGPAGGTPDPQCSGQGWRNKEAAGGCGIGFELAIVLPFLWALRARRGRREVRS